MGGSKKVNPDALLSDKLLQLNAAMQAGEALPSGEEWELEEGQSLVQFLNTAMAVLEGDGKAMVKLLRIGDLSNAVSHPHGK